MLRFITRPHLFVRTSHDEMSWTKLPLRFSRMGELLRPLAPVAAENDGHKKGPSERSLVLPSGAFFVQMHIHLREGNFDPFSIEAQLDLLSQFPLHSPVIFGFGPWSNDKIH